MSKLGRIARLVRAELLKIRSHPLFIVSILVILIVIPLAIFFQTPDETYTYSKLNSIQLFSYGFKYGFKVASVFILIFAAMIFSMEFDKGTIKNLLTRPVTRTEVFAAKILATAVTAAFLLLLTLYITLIFSLINGELGPIWDKEYYYIKMDYDALLDNLYMAVKLTLPSTIAAIFFGIAISTLTESSGNAVALALSIFMVLDFVSGFSFISSGVKFIFNYYPDYAFNTLKSFVEGYTQKKWEEDITKYYLIIPLAYSVVFAVVSYLVFKFKNIIA